MREWLEKYWAYLVIGIVFIVAAMPYACIAADLISTTKICQDAGYVGRAVIANDMICYGYEDGKRMIIVDFEDVKAGAE